MIDFNLQKELDINESDKQLLYAELEASQKKWAQYLINNKEAVCSFHHPIVVKKKRRVRFKEFIEKIKTLFGFNKEKDKRGEIDGIEAYLHHRINFERTLQDR